jgi:hypothetical protein
MTAALHSKQHMQRVLVHSPSWAATVSGWHPCSGSLARVLHCGAFAHTWALMGVAVPAGSCAATAAATSRSWTQLRRPTPARLAERSDLLLKRMHVQLYPDGSEPAIKMSLYKTEMWHTLAVVVRLWGVLCSGHCSSSCLLNCRWQTSGERICSSCQPMPCMTSPSMPTCWR